MAVLGANQSIQNAIQWLQTALQQLASEAAPLDTPEEKTVASQEPQKNIAWGSKVSPVFKARVLWIADALGCDASDLMACMAWESGESFSPNKLNMAGSGAIGLIQFMPATAKALGTTSKALGALSAEDQLRFVYEYFKPYAGRLHNLGDVYMAILWPKAVGQSDSFVLFDRRKTPTTFRQNAGLDIDHNGSVTRAECLVKINQKLAKGMQDGYIG